MHEVSVQKWMELEPHRDAIEAWLRKGWGDDRIAAAVSPRVDVGITAYMVRTFRLHHRILRKKGWPSGRSRRYDAKFSSRITVTMRPEDEERLARLAERPELQALPTRSGIFHRALEALERQGR